MPAGALSLLPGATCQKVNGAAEVFVGFFCHVCTAPMDKLRAETIFCAPVSTGRCVEVLSGCCITSKLLTGFTQRPHIPASLVRGGTVKNWQGLAIDVATNQLLVRPSNHVPAPALQEIVDEEINRLHVMMWTSAGSSPDIRSKDGMAAGHCSCIGPSSWTRLLSVEMPSHGRRRDAVVDAESCDKVGKISHLSHNARMSGRAVRYCSETSIFSNGKVS